MANGTELRGIALEILLEITQEKEYSHLAIRNALNKVQYLPKQDRAFINRLVEGTLEYMLRIDYVLNQFSSVRVNKMKPVIRNILRSGVYGQRAGPGSLQRSGKTGTEKRILQPEGICQRRNAQCGKKKRRDYLSG